MSPKIDANFKFYKQVTDDPEFARFFFGWLFERYVRGKQKATPRRPQDQDS